MQTIIEEIEELIFVNEGYYEHKFQIKINDQYHDINSLDIDLTKFDTNVKIRKVSRYDDNNVLCECTLNDIIGNLMLIFE